MGRPALDDVLYRYDAEEVAYWIVFGRANSPMPANGLEGGGAMSVQEVDQTIAWLDSIQVSQADAFARAVPAAEQALARIEGGSVSTQSLINRQRADIDDVNAAQGKVDVVGTFAEDVKDIFQGPGTCTTQSAAVIGAVCDDPGLDSDRDGLTDAAERELTVIAGISKDTITVIASSPNDDGVLEYTTEMNDLYDVRFDPFIAFTNETPEGSEADLEAAEALLDHLETDILLLNVTAERRDAFLADLEPGLAFLEDALADEPWAVDFDEVASDMGTSTDDAEFAVGTLQRLLRTVPHRRLQRWPGVRAGRRVGCVGSGDQRRSLRDPVPRHRGPDLVHHLRFPERRRVRCQRHRVGPHARLRQRPVRGPDQAHRRVREVDVMPQRLHNRFVREESGASTLEIVGVIAFIAALLSMVPFVREFVVDTIGIVFDQRDPDTGELTDFSVAMRGFGITAGSILVFIGAGWFLLWTNLGKRLAFLLTGAATFGWLVINGILFIVYAPRGIRPADLEGLNAIQFRLPAVAMTLGSLVLFAMFSVALTRYEADAEA